MGSPPHDRPPAPTALRLVARGEVGPDARPAAEAAASEPLGPAELEAAIAEAVEAARQMRREIEQRIALALDTWLDHP